MRYFHNILRFLVFGINGRLKAWQALLFCLTISFVYFSPPAILAELPDFLQLIPFFLVLILFGLSLYMLWRCAYNTAFPSSHLWLRALVFILGLKSLLVSFSIGLIAVATLIGGVPLAVYLLKRYNEDLVPVQTAFQKLLPIRESEFSNLQANYLGQTLSLDLEEELLAGITKFLSETVCLAIDYQQETSPSKQMVLKGRLGSEVIYLLSTQLNLDRENLISRYIYELFLVSDMQNSNEAKVQIKRVEQMIKWSSRTDALPNDMRFLLPALYINTILTDRLQDNLIAAVKRVRHDASKVGEVSDEILLQATVSKLVKSQLELTLVV